MAAVTSAKGGFSVDGKSAIITGAGSGINLAFAELLLSRNCNVVIADLTLRPEAKDLISRYADGGGRTPRAIFVETDVTSWRALEHMFEVALAEFGGFDIVCPGAGVYEPTWSSFWNPPGSAASRDAADADRYALLDINLTHPIRATQIAISHWLYPRPPRDAERPAPAAVSPKNPKRIVHVASVAAQIPVFRAPLYGASKFGISGFVRSLAPLDERGIRINAVAPGIVRTPLWTENPDKLANVDTSKDAWVTPQEVAEVMLDCVENGARASGAMVEVGAGHTREVQVFNDPGPNTAPEAGIITSNSEAGNEQVNHWLDDSSVWGSPPQGAEKGG